MIGSTKPSGKPFPPAMRYRLFKALVAASCRRSDTATFMVARPITACARIAEIVLRDEHAIYQSASIIHDLE
jgi:hypothetical protein